MRFEIRALQRGIGVSSLVIDALDAGQATARVREQGYAVLSIKTGSGWNGFSRQGKAVFALGQFSQELMTLLEAGLSIVEAIETLAEKEQKAERRQVLNDIIASLYRGQSLSSTLEQFPSIFSPLYVAMIRASETTGDLPESLGRYAAYQGQVDIVRKKIISASIYPALLIGVGSLVILFLLTYVMPRFSHIFEEVGHKAPLMSRLLIQWGHLLHDHGFTLALAAVAVIAASVYGLSLPQTRATIVAYFERIPMIGEQMRIYQLARFYRTVGMLLRGGMPILAAVSMAAGLLRTTLRQKLALATTNIREGMSISQAMEAHALITPVSLRMLRVGERTGRMGEMMERIARIHDDDIARWVDWFSRLFEPLLMTFIGVAIGGIVVLMYFPIFELAASIQ